MINSDLPRQIWRGCTDLPHVGPHPGTHFLLLAVLAPAFAGAYSGGIIGLLFGGLSSGLIFGSLYAAGARERARLSDRLVRREKIVEIVNAWITTLELPPKTTATFSMAMVPHGHGTKLSTLTETRNGDLDLPEELRTTIEHILTHPMGGGRRRHEPTAKDLKPFVLKASPSTSHEVMQAHAVLVRAKENP